MAAIDTAAIVTRIREVMTTTAGIVKPIPADRFLGELPPGISDAEASRRAMSTARYDVRVAGLTVHENSPPSLHSLVLYRIMIEILVVRHVNAQHTIIDASRDTVEALMAQDSDIISQPMCQLNNLLATNAGAVTGLVSGCLKYEGSEVTRPVASDEAGLLEAVHRFTGVVAVDR